MTSIDAWRAAGTTVRVMGLDLFVRDVPAPPEHGSRTPLLIFHGFPTSSHDWHLAVPVLAAERRVVLFDFPGYGWSDKPAEYSYSLHEQADAALGVCRALDLTSAHLVAHDMGTSVATEWLARREQGLLPFKPQSLLLMNGSVHIDLAELTLSQRLLRSPLGPTFARNARFATFRWQLRRILAKPVPDEELEAMWALMTRADGRDRMMQIMSYIGERTRFARRWIGALERLDLPARILWGDQDPVAVLAIAEALADETPGAALHTLDGLGHYPQLEDPAAVTSALNSWLFEVDHATL